MPERSYSSDAGTDESVSTKGISFELDGVEFECDGVFDPNDMMDLATDLQDATLERVDPSALGTVGYLIRTLMGEATWQAFRAHRRQHRTRPEVIAAIMNGLVEDVTNLPTARPSPSPGGQRQIPSSSPAASPLPGRRHRRPGAVPATGDGEILTVTGPARDREEDPPVHRTVSLKTGTVTVTDLAG